MLTRQLLSTKLRSTKLRCGHKSYVDLALSQWPRRAFIRISTPTGHATPAWEVLVLTCRALGCRWRAKDHSLITER